MIKFLSILISALVSATPATIPVKTAEKALQYSALLRMKTRMVDGHRYMGGCSGTYVAPRVILSAAHCFTDDPEFIWARDVNQKVGYPVKLLVMWKSHDLALLEAPFDHKYAKLGKSPRQGDEVLNVGSPFIFEFVVSEGTVAAVHFHIKGFKSAYLVTTAMINSGSSGGGAFNRKGQLIGVNTMTVGMFGWNGISMAVSVEDVAEMLRYIQ